MNKDEFLKRAKLRCVGDGETYWSRIISMVEKKPGIGITDRSAYTQKQWNWLQQTKAELKEPWE